MFAVRFAALMGLAVWVGGSVATFWLAQAAPDDPVLRMRGLGSLCGGVMIVALVVIKFVGPPPRHFLLRATIAALMLLVAVYADAAAVRSMAPAAINLLLGLTLLSWYAGE